MAAKFASKEFPGELIMLGTGTSTGVPAIGCQCDVCTSGDVHNRRTRCSIVLGAPEGNLLVDTPPDLRFQLLREKIGVIHSVLFTHEHADHIFGLDDLRLFQFYLGHPVPLLCEENVEERIRKSFDYAFTDRKQTHPGSIPSSASLPPTGERHANLERRPHERPAQSSAWTFHRQWSFAQCEQCRPPLVWRHQDCP